VGNQRLFVGLALPQDIARALSTLRRPIAGARWVDAENLHITLRFLGEVDDGVALEVDERLGAMRAASFDLEISSVGHFGSARNTRLLWAGIAPNISLDGLARAVDQALRVIAGLAVRDNRFHPHVTLARMRNVAGRGWSGARGGMQDDTSSAEVAAFLGAEAALRLAPFPVETFCLFSSRLDPGGARYRIEAEYPLVLWD
jgi:2'-5' RNA ligase